MEWILEIAAPSKLEVLRILYAAKEPLRLRTIAEISQVSLRPIQMALKKLEKLKYIKKQKTHSITTFRLLEIPKPLITFFEAIQAESKNRSLAFAHENAKSLGPFQEDAYKMRHSRRR